MDIVWTSELHYIESNVKSVGIDHRFWEHRISVCYLSAGCHSKSVANWIPLISHLSYFCTALIKETMEGWCVRMETKKLGRETVLPTPSFLFEVWLGQMQSLAHMRRFSYFSFFLSFCWCSSNFLACLFAFLISEVDISSTSRSILH